MFGGVVWAGCFYEIEVGVVDDGVKAGPIDLVEKMESTLDWNGIDSGNVKCGDDDIVVGNWRMDFGVAVVVEVGKNKVKYIAALVSGRLDSLYKTKFCGEFKVRPAAVV